MINKVTIHEYVVANLIMKYLIYVLLLIFAIGCKDSKEATAVQAPYNVPYPLKSPVEFANGKITTTNGISFSKNGKVLYISKSIDKIFENGKKYAGIFKYAYKNDKWNGPELIQFGRNIDAYHPVLSIDNETLYFNSRSSPDSTNTSIPHNIWFSKKTASGWSSAEMLKGINSERYDSYPSLAKNNNLYFNSDRAGGMGGMDIYVSNYVNGKYQVPINLQNLNSDQVENDLVVDPEEKFIVFNRYIDSTKTIDLYISFREGNDWGKPIPLDKINSPTKWELTPTLSPEGNYFFYELDGKIMQVDLGELFHAKR